MAKAKMLIPKEITAVLAHVGMESRYPERDRVMVLLSVRAGLRASEIAGLSWDHVLTADGSAVAEVIDLPRQITKGEKRARVIPIHDELKQALEKFIATYGRTAWDQGNLWSSLSGAAMARTASPTGSSGFTRMRVLREPAATVAAGPS